MELSERIEVDSERMNGKPVIKNTRITVELILKKWGKVLKFRIYWMLIPILKRKIYRLCLKGKSFHIESLSRRNRKNKYRYLFFSIGR